MRRESSSEGFEAQPVLGTRVLSPPPSHLSAHLPDQPPCAAALPPQMLAVYEEDGAPHDKLTAAALTTLGVVAQEQGRCVRKGQGERAVTWGGVVVVRSRHETW